MKLKTSIIYIILVLAILVAGGWAIFAKQKLPKEDVINFVMSKECGEYSKGQVGLNGKIIEVLISDTDCKRTQGLSGAKELKDGQGMLFIFEKVGNYGFWMKNMNFPIDILWIDDNFEIIGMEKDISPDTYPQSFGIKYLAKYVLEISANHSDKNNTKVGDKIIFIKNNL